MSTQEHVSMSARSGSFLPKRAAGLSLALLLLSGILHATPITSVAESQLQNPKQPVSRGAVTPTEAAPVAGMAPVAQDTLVTAGPVTAACILSSDCSTTVQVPEPQSLVLVGSGLLSMAGLIRRRLLR